MAITPYLYYRDVAGALTFLSKAFGLKKYGRPMGGPRGKLTHAAMRLGDDVVMLGCPGPKYKNPKQLRAVTQGPYINVDDVDRHCRRARKAGAKILEEPVDVHYGDRRYAAVDPEGHHWYFAHAIRKKAR